MESNRYIISSLKEKFDRHSKRWNFARQNDCQRLQARYGYDEQSYGFQEMAELLQRAKEVHEAVDKAKKERNLSNQEIERVKGMIDLYVKREKELFASNSIHFLELKNFERDDEMRAKAEKARLEEEAKREKARIEMERIRAQQEFQKRRSEQLEFAGHPAAHTIQFSSLIITKHAEERWNCRGMKSISFVKCLQEIDDANIFYKL